MHPKDAEGTANSVDPDQSAPRLFAPICLSENLGTLWWDEAISVKLKPNFYVLLYDLCSRSEFSLNEKQHMEILFQHKSVVQ